MNMSNKLTEKDLETIDKIEYEGGVIDALEYGVKEDDFDNPELKSAWKELSEICKVFIQKEQVFESLVDDHMMDV